jgi:DNA-binding LytR/AlgR family response regulator
MTCIAIDDEPLALRLLTRYCGQASDLQLLGAYTDPLQGLAHVRRAQPELLFLDVHMPDISGLHIAQTLPPQTLIILATAHKEYALEAFDLNVVDYLLKPFSLDRFLAACQKARLRLPQADPADPPAHSPSLTFRANCRTVRLPHADILYIEACNNYVKIVTPAKTYLPALSLKTIQNLLPETHFFRIHKSYIVALAHIRSFSRDQVVTERRALPVGRMYCKCFLERMQGGL